MVTFYQSTRDKSNKKTASQAILQGLAESFISPRFLEFFSLQAPKGEEGMYLGFSHLHSFISSILGFGFLLFYFR